MCVNRPDNFDCGADSIVNVSLRNNRDHIFFIKKNAKWIKGGKTRFFLIPIICND